MDALYISRNQFDTVAMTYVVDLSKANKFLTDLDTWNEIINSGVLAHLLKNSETIISLNALRVDRCDLSFDQKSKLIDIISSTNIKDLSIKGSPDQGLSNGLKNKLKESGELGKLEKLTHLSIGSVQDLTVDEKKELKELFVKKGIHLFIR